MAAAKQEAANTGLSRISAIITSSLGILVLRFIGLPILSYNLSNAPQHVQCQKIASLDALHQRVVVLFGAGGHLGGIQLLRVDFMQHHSGLLHVAGANENAR